MKKFITHLLILCISFSIVFLPQIHINALENDNEISVYIDGEKVILDIPPVVVNNRALVPIRGIFEKLGATVDWNKETKQVIVKNKAVEVLLEVDNQAVLVNGKIKFLDTASQLTNSRTLVPVRFVAEALGHDVHWSSIERRIDITTKPSNTTNQENELPILGSAKALTQLLHYNHVLDAYFNRTFLAVDDALVTTDGNTEEVSPALEPSVDTASDQDSSKTSTDDDFSGTNNQTEGVDEGDIIKTDGKFIYSLNQNRVHIIDPTPTNPSILSTLEIDDQRGYVSDIYIQENSLVLIGTGWVHYGYPKDLVNAFGSSFVPTYSTDNTFVLVYDISDPTKPLLTKDMDFEGSLVSSRLIEDKLYVISSKGINYWTVEPMYRMTIDPVVQTFNSKLISEYYAPQNTTGLSDEVYKEKLQAMYDYQFMPKYADNMTGQSTIIDYNHIQYFPDYITPNFMLTIGIDLGSDVVDVKSYLGSAEIVYASADNLYLTFTKYEYASQYNTLVYVPNYNKSTAIYKFKLENGQINYEATGSVPGSIVNQFSMDEFNDNLRIATTTGEMWDTNNISKNNVYILDSGLTKTGELTDLAPGERIYSTRFAGNRIYMVTFRQVDPFFVIDATDPKAPKVLGDLKIPGFSTYMHILDEDHVLGFGSDTVEKDGFVTTGGFKISLYDVSDPMAPIEKSKEVIGTTGTYSELQYNHNALMISLNKGIMAFPISVCGKVPYVTDFSGAYVYNIANDNFSYKGIVTHQPVEPQLGEGDYKYFDTNYNINRLVYIGDYLYSLSNNKMVVTGLKDMNKLGEVSFPEKVYNYNDVLPIESLPSTTTTK